ncbi:MAG: O-antigen ligase family protein [Anaerovoracaceae bacterium]
MYIRGKIKFDNILMALLVINCFLCNLGLYNYRTSPAVMVSICILMIYLFYIRSFSKKNLTAIEKFIIIFLLVISVSYAINGIVYKVPTYITCFILFGLILPIYFIKVNRSEIKKIIGIFTQTTIICFLFIIIASFLVAPITSEQYSGVFNNPNLLGECISVVIISLIFQFENARSYKYKLVILIIFGMSTALMFFSMSRTTLLSVGIIAIVYFAFNIKNKFNVKKKLIAFLLSILIMLPITYGILNIVTPQISNIVGINLTEEYQSREKLGNVVDRTLDRYKKGIGDDRTFSSGRIEIWKEYAENLSVAGHDASKLNIEYNGEIIQANAHNSFLQISYHSGIISGICYILILLYVSISIIKKFIKNRNIDNNLLFGMMAVLSLFVYSSLSNIVIPTISFTMVPMWIIVLPLILSKKEES